MFVVIFDVFDLWDLVLDDFSFLAVGLTFLFDDMKFFLESGLLELRMFEIMDGLL